MTYDPSSFYSPVTVAVDAFVRLEWPLSGICARTKACVLASTRYRKKGPMFLRLDVDATTMETLEHMVWPPEHNHDV